ncbi:lytic polysaccharide monooxygenase [Streptomyces sp. FL07-04A]|uniref:lytic polysaccharide monooxygenase auxiliary activity family 9 protein n=1 Tax=Streptomyces sp. FL07-04A TaxID=3028658 RepID=UPI0029A029E1|nr:lytic polysaccharide monooxygenase [Streptomyces sp. FL07-04A]MDX3579545.1 lytic polysaccharide monooxygenase [Streptomyces sp. FL07-04A]
MPRTTAHRTAALASAVAAPFLLGLWAAGPAQAHGAPTDPVSRVYACSPEGGADAGSAACRAAVRANGTSFAAWDNLRVAGVNGRDRQTVPDGRLCSGGLAAYRGLDLARADWPSTRLEPGGTLRMTYASTIAHEGTFKLYLTKPGYDPSKPLTWSDLPERPFAQVRNPKLTNGAYRFAAKLPADRTGRQVLYTIWQNSSTPDTYYSCSDVVFPQAVAEGKTDSTPRAGTPATAAARTASPSASPSPTASAVSAAPSASVASDGAPARPVAAPQSTPVAADTDGSGPSAPLLAGGAAAVLLLTGGAALAVRLRRR